MKYNLANYPNEFKGCVISPTKICLQYKNVQTKLRLMTEHMNYLPKDTSCERYLPIYANGTDIDILSVGCQLPIVENMTLGLIDAYKTYYYKHELDYATFYGRPLKDFIIKLKTQVDDLYNFIVSNENGSN